MMSSFSSFCPIIVYSPPNFCPHTVFSAPHFTQHSQLSISSRALSSFLLISALTSDIISNRTLFSVLLISVIPPLSLPVLCLLSSSSLPSHRHPSQCTVFISPYLCHSTVIPLSALSSFPHICALPPTSRTGHCLLSSSSLASHHHL